MASKTGSLGSVDAILTAPVTDLQLRYRGVREVKVAGEVLLSNREPSRLVPRVIKGRFIGKEEKKKEGTRRLGAGTTLATLYCDDLGRKTVRGALSHGARFR